MKRIKKYGPFFLACLLVQLAIGQSYQKQFGVRDNRMFILISKNLPLPSLDSFIRTYQLNAIGLHSLINAGNYDSVQKSGWQLDDASNPGFYKLSKQITGSSDLKRVGEIAVFSAVPIAEDLRIIGDNRVVFGANHFKNNYSFQQEAGITYFFLSGYAKAKRVQLAGSFSNWQFNAFPMSKTDSGWIAAVKLEPGQYFYKFIVDGNWITDPRNQRAENDDKGNTNSVYFVPNKIFSLDGYQQAKTVALSGTFNNWAKNDLLLQKQNGGWQLALYLQPGTYRFHFIADGKIIEEGDEKNKQQLALGRTTVFNLKGFEKAKKVRLAGNFNDWNPDEIEMTRSANGWTTSYALGPGNYEYKFIVDGNWITDPDNPSIVDDGDGNRNSFRVVSPNYTFHLKGYAKARKVVLAGEFNNWSPDGLAMQHAGDEWICPLYLGRGKHLYKFIVDGKWMKDPANPLWEDDNENSVIWIE